MRRAATQRLPWFVLALASCLPAAAEIPHAVSRGASVMVYGDYEPRQVYKLDEVPPQVRVRLIRHLQQRLGAVAFPGIRFIGGEIVDRRALPAQDDFAPEVPTYRLHFAFRRPEVGIDLYVATIALREDASVIEDITLPCFACHPEKLQFVDLQEAAATALANGMSEARMVVDIDYDREADSLAWSFSQRLQGEPNRYDRLLVDAHTGAIVRRYQYEGAP